MDRPLLVFLISFIAMGLATRVGIALSKWHRGKPDELHDTLGVLQASALTLLGLIIAFTFSMAVSRYDQRKNYEEAEANAIGTEYVRIDILPAANAAQLRPLLLSYLDQRILFYEARESSQLRQIELRKRQLQSALWSAVVAPATAQQTPVMSLAVSGMNDVLNSEGYTQAAWWNRIPISAWCLTGIIAIFCNLLVGYGAPNLKTEPMLSLILPFILSISFMLIADIDSPRGGLIKVSPQNLIVLAQSLREQ
jgi:hypothetical protein